METNDDVILKMIKLVNSILKLDILQRILPTVKVKQKCNSKALKRIPLEEFIFVFSIPDIYSQDPLANCPIGLHVPCNIFSSVD